MDDYYKAVTELLHEEKNLVIGTVTPDGKPWTSPVAVAYDEKLNFYWYSHYNTQHSKNIRTNGDAFGVLFNKRGIGLYLQGYATEINDESVARQAQSVYTTCFSAEKIGDFIHPAERRFYLINPKRIWTNDTVKKGEEFLKDFRIELNIEELQRRIRL